MVARISLATNASVYASVDQSIARWWGEKEMIEPHPFVERPPIALVIPERPERPVWLQRPQSIRPAES